MNFPVTEAREPAAAPVSSLAATVRDAIRTTLPVAECLPVVRSASVGA